MEITRSNNKIYIKALFEDFSLFSEAINNVKHIGRKLKNDIYLSRYITQYATATIRITNFKADNNIRLELKMSKYNYNKSLVVKDTAQPIFNNKLISFSDIISFKFINIISTTDFSFDYIEFEIFIDNENIQCFNNNKEDIVMGKNLKSVLSITGKFRDIIDIINPVFDIELDEVPTFNYIFLNMFGRYYFVDNIECIRNNLYRIYCSIDVLESHKDQLKDLDVYVTRQEFNVNTEVPDGKIPIEIGMEYIYDNLPNQITGINFPSDRSMDTFYYALTVVAVSPLYKDSEKDKVPTVYNKTSTTLLLSANQLEIVIKKILGTDSIIDDIKRLWNDSSDAFISVKQFPWDLVNKVNIPNKIAQSWLIGSQKINFETNIHGVLYNNDERIWNEIECGEFNLTRLYNDWRDFKPYTKISMFIPFVGWVELDNETIYSENFKIDNKYRIQCRYVLDVISGDCIFQIYNYIKNGSVITTPDTISQKYAYLNIIEQYQCSPCDNVLVANSNHLEMLRKGIDLGTNALSAVTSGISAFGNLKMANALNMKQKGVRRTSKQLAVDKTRVSNAQGGILENFSNSVSNLVSSAISDTAQSKVFSTNSAGFINLDTSSKLMIRYERYKFKEPDEYAHILGRPSTYYGKLEKLSGYTEVGAFHLENINGITTEEKDLIESLLRSGIIIE